VPTGVASDEAPCHPTPIISKISRAGTVNRASRPGLCGPLQSGISARTLRSKVPHASTHRLTGASHESFLVCTAGSAFVLQLRSQRWGSCTRPALKRRPNAGAQRAERSTDGIYRSLVENGSPLSTAWKVARVRRQRSARRERRGALGGKASQPSRHPAAI